MDCEIEVKVKYGWLHSRGHAKMYACASKSYWETDLNTNTSQVQNITLLDQ